MPITLRQHAMMGWSAATAIRMAKRYGHIGSQALGEAADILGGTKLSLGSSKSPKVNRGGKCSDTVTL